MKKLLTVMALATMTLTSSAQLRSGIDLKDLNTSVRPADDFYEYACGGWMKANPLPPAYSRYGSFDRLAEDNNKRINGILKELLENSYPQGSVEQKLSDLYKLAMDSARREKEGVAPLMGELKTLENAKNKEQLFNVQLSMMPYGESEFFSAYIRVVLHSDRKTIIWRMTRLPRKSVRPIRNILLKCSSSLASRKVPQRRR